MTSSTTERIINGVIGRIDRDDSRYYIDPADSSLIYDSVSTVLSATNSKQYLVNWSAKLAAEFAANHHDFIGQTIEVAGKGGAVDLIKGQSKRLRELSADIGTHQHEAAGASAPSSWRSIFRPKRSWWRRTSAVRWLKTWSKTPCA